MKMIGEVFQAITDEYEEKKLSCPDTVEGWRRDRMQCEYKMGIMWPSDVPEIAEVGASSASITFTLQYCYSL